jgi:outer membrane protein OmpA-like peptidoglycan-associated protein
MLGVRLALALLLLGLSAGPSRAAASPWGIRGGGAAATMMSADQLDRLDYDKVGFLGSLSVAREIIPYLGAQASLRGGTFLSRQTAGGLVALGLGPVVRGKEGTLVPFASLEAGGAFTGRLKRPWLSASVGLDVRVNTELYLGPLLGIDAVLQHNRAGASSDAVFLWLGISLRYWPSPTPPKPKPPVVELAVAPPIAAPPREPQDDAQLRALIERTIDPAPIRHELLAPILFGNDSALLDPHGIALLHEVARTLKTNKKIRMVEIRGYADRRGSEAHNRVLSEERARQVEGWLIEHGISPSRLRVMAEGEGDPVEFGSDAEQQAQNRRVVFRIIETSER